MFCVLLAQQTFVIIFSAINKDIMCSCKLLIVPNGPNGYFMASGSLLVLIHKLVIQHGVVIV